MADTWIMGNSGIPLKNIKMAVPFGKAICSHLSVQELGYSVFQTLASLKLGSFGRFDL